MTRKTQISWAETQKLKDLYVIRPQSNKLFQDLVHDYHVMTMEHSQLEMALDKTKDEADGYKESFINMYRKIDEEREGHRVIVDQMEEYIHKLNQQIKSLEAENSTLRLAEHSQTGSQITEPSSTGEQVAVQRMEAPTGQIFKLRSRTP